MPARNNFRHQTYSADPPAAPFELIRTDTQPKIDGDEFNDRLVAVGEKLAAARVRRIYLLPGTFAGTDSLGLIREIGRLAPSVARQFEAQRKQAFDTVAGDTGNFSRGFAERFQAAINRRTSRQIDVGTFDWSSENHHLGRADGAVRLFMELAKRGIKPPDRILLVGHSHAGNIFALLTNLLTSDAAALQEFFRMTHSFYRWPLFPIFDVPQWKTAQELLRAGGENPFLLDIVTMGTPVRYGWDSAGYANLIHLIHHRPSDGLPVYQAPFPPRLEELRNGSYGDYMQQFGIAGTNLIPYSLSWRNWQAEQRLNAFLQPDLPKRKLIERLRFGQRAHHDGTNVFVDYSNDNQLRSLMLGHGIYTRREWLVFHAEWIANRFYVG